CNTCQLAGEVIEVSDTHRAAFASKLETPRLTLRHQPGDAAESLREMGVRHHGIGRSPEPDVEGIAAARRQSVVEAAAIQRAFGVQQRRVAEFLRLVL